MMVVVYSGVLAVVMVVVVVGIGAVPLPWPGWLGGTRLFLHSHTDLPTTKSPTPTRSRLPRQVSDLGQGWMDGGRSQGVWTGLEGKNVR